MSHWTTVQTKMTNLDMLKRAIADCGCQFNNQTEHVSEYAGKLACVGTISKAGRSTSRNHGAAIVQDDVNYQITMDNYSNTLKEVAGNSCEKITQTYAKLETAKEMANAGYLKQSSRVEQDSGDLVMVYAAV